MADRSVRGLMRIALMIEGQEDVSWADWIALADSVRRVRHRGALPLRSLPAVRRGGPPPRSSRRLDDDRRLGIAHDSSTARHMCLAGHVAAPGQPGEDGRDNRPRLGWSRRTWSRRRMVRRRVRSIRLHLPGPAERQDILEQTVEIVCRMWTDESPFSFRGRHFQLDDCRSRPRPRATAPPTPDRRGQRRTA